MSMWDVWELESLDNALSRLHMSVTVIVLSLKIFKKNNKITKFLTFCLHVFFCSLLSELSGTERRAGEFYIATRQLCELKKPKYRLWLFLSKKNAQLYGVNITLMITLPELCLSELLGQFWFLSWIKWFISYSLPDSIIGWLWAKLKIFRIPED